MESNYRHICPQCGYEYESWVQVCPDCNRVIEDRYHDKQPEPLEGELSDHNPRWTIVTNVPNAIIGNLIKSQLEDAGIPVLMLRSSSADIAEFSHNDFVPQDIRVPRAMWQEARQLVDSPASDSLPFANWQENGAEDSPENDAIEAGQQRELPDGWQVLPAEGTGQASASLTGWHWSDNTAPAQLPQYDPHWQGLYDAGQAEEEEEVEEPQRQYDYRPSYSAGTPGYGQPTWIRLVYALLLLVMSLPFIMGVLQQFWRIWQPQP